MKPWNRIALTLVLAPVVLPSALAQTPAELVQQVVSREVSIHVGGVQEPEYRELVSRELSIFSGDEPVPPYQEALSREFSVFIGAEPDPPYRQIISREVSVLQPNGASFFAIGGEKLILPMVQDYKVRDAENTTTYLRAVGVGSVLSLPNLTNLVGNARANGYLRIEALEAGRVELASLLGMTQPYDGTKPTTSRGIQVLADGPGSVVDLSGLMNFADLAVTPGSRFEARNGGTILLGAGAKLALKQVSLLATGSGTVLDLSGLKVFEGGATSSTNCLVQATAGATLNLPKIEELGPTAINFLADGVGSVIDLSGLVRFIGGSLEARNSGVIRTPKLFFVDRARIIVRNTGRIDVAQIRKLTDSRVTADGTTLAFAELFNWTGTVFDSANAGSVDLPQIDLALSHLTTSTNELWCGDPVTVSWQGFNPTGAAIMGGWTDALYLSKDDRWDIDDLLIGRVDQTQGLAAGEVYTATANVFVPGVLPGEYHLLVRSVALGFMGTLGQDNTFATAVPILMPELTVGTPIDSAFLAPGHARYWKLVVEPDKDLEVALELLPTNGAAELYLSQDVLPTRTAYHLKFTGPSATNQVIRIPGTRTSTNYVLAYCLFASNLPAGFTATGNYLSLAFNSFAPDRGGNLGEVTLRIMGQGMSSKSVIALTVPQPDALSRELLPVRTWHTSQEHIYATFDLRGLSPTNADVVLRTPTGQESRIERGFAIVPGVREQLRLTVDGPSVIARARAVHGGIRYGIYKVAVRNDSNEDAGPLVVSLWLPESPMLSASVSGDYVPGTLNSSKGYLATAIPWLGPGEMAELEYNIGVGSLEDGSMLLQWLVESLDRRYFLEEAANVSEELRNAVLRIDNIEVENPEGYRLAANPIAWLNYATDTLRAAGFLADEEQLSGRGLFGHRVIADGNSCARWCSYEAALFCAGAGALGTLLSGPFGFGVGLGCSLGSVEVCIKKCGPPPPPTPPPAPVCEVLNFGPVGNAKVCTPAALDPNDISGSPGWGNEHFVSAQSTFGFTVDFENLPSASAAVLRLSVTNQLESGFDPATVEIKEVGFGGTRFVVPRGLSHYETTALFDGWTWGFAAGWQRGKTPLMVDVNAGVDVTTGLLTLNLTCADTNTGTFPEDAYAGFLPPNRPELFYYPTNDLSCCGVQVNTNVLVQPGQGYIVYTVRPRADLPTGTVITNAAQIVFDWNEPIDTPVVFNTIDAGAPSSSVQPLPAESAAAFVVEWSGEDDAGGSGINGYDIYVSADGGAFERWLTDVPTTSEQFLGVPGVTYRFYSVARDNVGNTELPPAVADAETRVTGELRLQWQVQGATLLLSWPGSLAEAFVESAGAVNGPYGLLGVAPILEGDRWLIELPLQQSQAYFRLRLP